MSRKLLLTGLGLYVALTSLTGCVVEPARPVTYYAPSPPPPQYYVAPAPVYYYRYYR